MPRNKGNNQYCGKAFEIYLSKFLSNNNFIFEEEKLILNKVEDLLLEIKNDAEICSKRFDKRRKIKDVKWVGNRTNNENCDIIIDDKKYEIKYVSQGAGTYFNTSIYYLLKYNFDYREYLKKYRIYDKLKEIPNITVSENNKSPVSIKDSSFIRTQEEHKDIYEEIKKEEKECRLVFVNDLYNYFKNNNKELYNFVYDMVNKNTTKNKNGAPDTIVIFNYKNKETKFLNIKDIILKDISPLKREKASLIWNNIRICFSWQNGIGLNNPTIRIFI